MAPPVKYSPEDFEIGLKSYFEAKAKEKNKIKYMSVWDICVFLGISYDTWENYAQKPEYTDSIKEAKTILTNNWMENLALPGRNSTGTMFYLKNTIGWADKQEIKQETTTTINVIKIDQIPQQHLKLIHSAITALPTQNTPAPTQKIVDVTPAKPVKSKDDDPF
jgi:hypothetical protein